MEKSHERMSGKTVSEIAKKEMRSNSLSSAEENSISKIPEGFQKKEHLSLISEIQEKSRALASQVEVRRIDNILNNLEQYETIISKEEVNSLKVYREMLGPTFNNDKFEKDLKNKEYMAVLLDLHRTVAKSAIAKSILLDAKQNIQKLQGSEPNQ